MPTDIQKPLLSFPHDESDCMAFLSFKTVKHTMHQKSVEGIANLFNDISSSSDGVKTDSIGAPPSIAGRGGLTLDYYRRKLSEHGIDDIEDAVLKTLNFAENNKIKKLENVRFDTSVGRWVNLYMPAAIQLNDAATYDNVDLGTLGRIATAAIASGKIPGVGDVTSAAGQGISSFVNLVTGQVGDKLDAASTVTLAKALNKIPWSEARAASEGAFGTKVNQNPITSFQSVPLRQLTFTFKLMPSSPEEAQTIKEIVRFFRTEVYPLDIGGLAYRYPNAFEITQVYTDHLTGKPAVLTKFLPAFLTAVSTTFNPNSNGFMVDGEWSEVDITLTFQEERAMTRNDVEEANR